MALSKIVAGSPVRLSDINGIIDAVNAMQSSSVPTRNDCGFCL